MISTNALSVFIVYRHLNGIGNENLCSVQDVMRASEPAAKKIKNICENFSNLAILTKSSTPGEIQLMFGHAAVGIMYALSCASTKPQLGVGDPIH